MGDRTAGDDFASRPTWNGVRVWHLAMVVGVVALLLGGLVALKKEAEGSGVGGGLVISGVIGVFAITCYGSARLGVWLAQGPLDRLGSWGVRRGGLAEFLAWLIASVAEAAVLVGSVALGLGAAYGIGWLILAG